MMGEGIVKISLFPGLDRITMADCLNVVCEVAGIDRQHLTGPRRTHGACKPRWLAMFLMTDLTPASNGQIGRTLNRHHATVLHGVRRAEDLIATDGEMFGWHGRALELLSDQAGVRYLRHREHG